MNAAQWITFINQCTLKDLETGFSGPSFDLVEELEDVLVALNACFSGKIQEYTVAYTFKRPAIAGGVRCRLQILI